MEAIFVFPHAWRGGFLILAEHALGGAKRNQPDDRYAITKNLGFPDSISINVWNVLRPLSQ
jgi:hypothetical protein